MREPILVTGATGRHGGTSAHLAGALLTSGHRVRVLARRESERTAALAALGAEIRLGDFSDRRSLIAGLEDVSTATFTYPVAGGIVPAAATFASAARERGARLRLVVMSMAIAHPDGPSQLGRAQWLAEEILSWANLELCVLRIAALFLENLAVLHGQSIRTTSVFGNSFGDAKVPWMSAADAGRLMAAAVLRPELFEGKAIHYPPGAELRSHDEIAEMLSTELARPIRFNALTRDQWATELLDRARSEPEGVVNADMAAHIPAVGSALSGAKALIRPPDPGELQRITGSVPISVRQFLAANRNAFIQ